MFRYVAMAWDISSPPQSATAALLITRLRCLSTGWQPVLSAAGFSVFCAGARPGASAYYPLANQSGVVLGTLFALVRGPCERRLSSTVTALSLHDTRRILDSQGEELICGYWGRYVAFLHDAATHTKSVIKDPTGRLPCFSTRHDDVFLFFSCLSDCIHMTQRQLTLNWPYIRRRVAISTGGATETAFNEVSRICGGERLQIRGESLSRKLLWRPCDIAESNVMEDPAAAGDQMRHTAEDCTVAWMSGHEQVLHRLSGGLDSSIVLGCARNARARCKVTCVTYYRPGGNSDERPWSRLAARHAGCAHVEYPRNPRLDFKQLSRLSPLPYPPDDLSFLELSAVEHQLALEERVTAIFSGDGGDAVLGSHGARFAALDALRRHGLGWPLLEVTSAVAVLFNVSVWRVLTDALRRTYLGAPRREQDWQRSARSLVREEVFVAASKERSAHKHPWFHETETPSSLSELLGIAEMADPFYDPLRRPEEAGVEYVFPLLSQPFVELCLRIPSYVHLHAGQDRGLARRAFAGVVPPAILTRYWKDRAQGFTEEILFHARDFARPYLLEGVLIREKLLDAREVERALSGLRAKSSAYVGEILDHLVTEAWLRTWVQARSPRLTSTF